MFLLLATCVTNIGFIIGWRRLKLSTSIGTNRKPTIKALPINTMPCTGLYPLLYRVPIGTIVYGYNGDFKRSIDLCKMTKEQFTQISFVNLTGSTGRTSTSKASCLDPKQPYTGTFIHRGLYQFADAEYSEKVSRTSVSGNCVGGFWAAL